MSKETLPRNPNLPTPPYQKPPQGYDPIPGDELEARLSNASKEDLILLLVKSWNAGALTIYEKSADDTNLEGGEDENGDPPYETDEINGWPPD